MYFVCPLAETCGAQGSYGVQPRCQRLVHQPPGREEAFPRLDDGGVLRASPAGLHPHLPRVPDHHVSDSCQSVIRPFTINLDISLVNQAIYKGNCVIVK